MIVIDIAEIRGTERDVSTDQWTSLRLLLKQDQMGFSMHVTTIPAGEVLEMQYRNHKEAVYCVDGVGSLHDLDTDTVYPIKPGVLYALDSHERHILKATTQLTTVCVFNPPLIGREKHDSSGSYPILETD